MNRFLTLLLAASCLTAFGQLPDYVPANGLISWHNLNGNAIDEMGMHDGTLTGSYPVANRHGEEGAALGFEDGDYADLGTYSEIQGLCEFSTSIWFFGLEEQGSGCCNMLWCSGYNQFLLNLGTWNPSLSFDPGLSCGAPPASTVFDGQLYGQWHHAVAQLVGGNEELWLDGALVSSSPLSSCVCSHSDKMTLATMDGFPHHLNGYLDEFGVWNRALSAEEIQFLYSQEQPTYGCTDANACNFNEDAIIDDGTCHFLCQYCIDGTIWNEELQGCVHGQSADIDNDGCVQLGDLLDLLAAYGDCGQEESAWQCGDPLEYQGYDYETVQIGEQCWFAENLRSESFINGDMIPSGLSDGDWQNTTSAAAAAYGEDAGCDDDSPDISACDPTQSYIEYGFLYNWYAIDDSRGLCPTGWHVPSDDEWMTLEIALGMSESEANNTDVRGTDQGGQMKTDYGWNFGNGTNSSGFSGLPGGYRNGGGFFYGAGNDGLWWSSSVRYDGQAWDRIMQSSIDGVRRTTNTANHGFSVRCIQG